VDGAHDLGGAQGFGPVVVEPDEPPFHEPWEGRVHGMMLNCVAGGVITGGRLNIELMDPVHYLSTSYYEHWLAGLETGLVRAGVLTQAEIDAAVAAGRQPERRDEPERADFVRSILQPFAIDDPTEPAPRFTAGDRVRVRRMRPTGHTRCPRYVRGATGTIALVHEPSPLPDTGSGHPVTRYYTVEFTGDELWGGDAEPNTTVLVDLWEQYLEDAS
jgi:nitrile hydratase